jgi:hypothetical protein
MSSVAGNVLSARCVLAARTSEESAAPVSHSRAYSSRLSDNDRAGTPSVSRPALSSPPFNDRAYRLFLYGYDTYAISAHLGIPEHVALKRITLERDRLNGTRTEFEGRLS